MKDYYPPMLPNVFYHVFNRANSNKDLLFVNDGNYEYFLTKFADHLCCVVEIYTFCLLGNHFHFLVKVKSEIEIREWLKQTPKFEKMQESPVHEVVSEVFRRFFIAYAKAFNKQQNRRGSLFEKDFKRVAVDNDWYFGALIYYIHLNMVKHGISEDFENYKWSSYNRILDPRPTLLQKEFILKWFGGAEQYIAYHKKEPDMHKMSNFVIE